ncbi:zinc ribbon domain-containing protein [bacterium BFN5]|nr:zinc ribbon domain-containing protein [bacterium BFN5]
MLRFCPACGDRLLQGKLVKFCSNCGQNLNKLSAAANDVEPIEQSSHAHNPEKTEAVHDSQPSDESQSDDYYSIVLKTCGNKERLVKRLSKILSRSLTATQLAVELVPCVILYKSKEAAVQAVIDILEEEQLHYAVIKGDFEFVIPYHETDSLLITLDDELRQLLGSVPAGLWLGEKIKVIIPGVEHQGNFGTLIATERALYLISKAYSDQPWHIIPFIRLADVVLSNVQYGEIDLVYKQYGCDEFLRIDNGEHLIRLYEHLKAALAK